MKRIVTLLFALLIVCVSVTATCALDYGCDVETTSGAIYMECMDTGTVVFEKNADQTVYPASTTKIMTYIVVVENVGDIDNTRVEITESALETLDPESSVMGLKDHIGESFTVRDLLYGLLVPSGNDAALVLATYVGNGNIDAFVALMNNKAAELGCNATHFANPHGLYDPDHYSTARDMATITKYAMQKDGFMEISNTVSYYPEGFIAPILTTNYMIDESQEGGKYYYEYTKGIKTGFTDEAGKCLITTAEKDGVTYLCIAMGAAYTYEENVNYAMLDSKELYEWAFAGIGVQTIYSTIDPVESIPIDNLSNREFLDLVPEREVKALLPLGYDETKITVDGNYPESVNAPIVKGDVIGEVKICYDGEEIDSVNLVAAETFESETFSFLGDNTDNILKLVIIGIIVLVVIVLVIIIIAARARNRRRREAAQRRRYRR